MVRYRNTLHKITLFVLMICGAVACRRDDLVIPSPDETDGGKVTLTLSIDATDYDTPVTKADENTIGAPVVLVYTGTDPLTAEFSEAVQAVSNGTKMEVTLTESDQPSLFVVIANPPATFHNQTDQTDHNFTPTVLNELLEQTSPYELAALVRTPPLNIPQTASPYSGPTERIPMSGISDPVSKIEDGMTIQNGGGIMTLHRAVAKVYIGLSSSLTNFTLSGAGLLGVNRTGALYRLNSDNENFDDMAIPLAPERVDYLAASEDEIILNAGSQTSPLYLYETSRLEDEQAALVMKAEWNGTPYYYKLGFVNDGKNLNILRGHHYIFTVEKAGPGYATLEDAWNGPISNITYTVKVIDGTAHDIVGNGQYYLGLSNSEVLNYGVNTTFNDAFVITTDCIAAWGSGEITLTPSSGISITSPAGGKIALPTSGMTTATVNFTATAATFNGTIEVKVGNLTQTVTFRRRTYLPFSGYGELPYDDYVQCDLPEATRDWFKLKGKDNQRFSQDKTFREGQKVYIDADQYTTSNGTRETTFHMARNAGGRAKIYVTQQGVDRSTVTHRVPKGGYVGAFWRASQTGERLIHIPYNEDIVGDWTATVVEGEDWIKLDMEMTSDQGVTWVAGSENPADMIANDGLYQVPGDGLSVGGTVEGAGDKIYFRIGLRNTIPEGRAPRYGAILMSYAMKGQSTHYCYLYLRQGEEADYLFRPTDPDVYGTGGWGDGEVHRPYAARYSPFNITAVEYKENPYYIADMNSGTRNFNHPQVDRAEFVDYPTQAGAMFTIASIVNKKRAWHPIFPGGSFTYFFSDSEWPSTSTDYYGTNTWAEIKEEHESCPENYRHMRDHYDDASNSTNQAVEDSELRQSLILIPSANATTIGNSTSPVNYYVGYYADGYFDRRGLVINADNEYMPTHAVAADGTLVAYRGMLFFNRYNNASLFFPQAGGRSVRGPVSQMGKTGRYWTTTSSGSLYRSWQLVLSSLDDDRDKYNHGGSITFNRETYRHNAFTIRCVKDEPYY